MKWYRPGQPNRDFWLHMDYGYSKVRKFSNFPSLCFAWNQFWLSSELLNQKRRSKTAVLLDRHISRISRENEKWFCETFLARNAAREIARKNDQNLANLWPNLTKMRKYLRTKCSKELKVFFPFISHTFSPSNKTIFGKLFEGGTMINGTNYYKFQTY